MIRATAALIAVTGLVSAAPASGETSGSDPWSTTQTLVCGTYHEIELQRAGKTLAEIETALGDRTCAFQTGLPPAYVDHGGTLVVGTHRSADLHGTTRFSGAHHHTCYYVRTVTGYIISPCAWRQQIDLTRAVQLMKRLPLPPVRLAPIKKP